MSDLEKDQIHQSCINESQAEADICEALTRETGTARRQEQLKALWKLIQQRSDVAANVSANTPIASGQSARNPSKPTVSHSRASATSS